ncbi:hypothetical protein MHBO_004468 [Bonamia ostreae]|uniref:B box-type domain-containing protein n=1 Tax=Bonamia ostreae TaxID=126728 RepID=A0ABV2ATG8_9EUKA
MNGVDSKIEASFEDMCVECEDQPHSVLCETCKESFCLPCFQQIHQKGTRKKHQYKDSQRSKSNADSKTETKVGIALDEQDDYNVLKLPEKTRKEQYGATFELFDNFSIETFVERAKYIPLRPTMKERKLLRLVEATVCQF